MCLLSSGRVLCTFLVLSNVLGWYEVAIGFSLLKLPKSSKQNVAALFKSHRTATGDDSVETGGLPHVVVVGGGVGGLAVAIRIASSQTPCRVSVLEKNSMLGGRCGSFLVETDEGTFRHERGPSLLLLREVYQDLFQECSGKGPEHYGLIMKQCIPAYQVVFEDGDNIQVGFPDACSSPDVKSSKRQSRDKMDAYEPDGASKWDEYMQSTAAFLDCGLPNFIEERLDLPSFPAFIVESLRDWGKSWPLRPHSDVLDATFTSHKMRALASFQNLYVGLEPYRNDRQLGGGVLRKTAPAVFGLLAAIELHPSNKNAGVFAPVGGFQAVTDAFQRLAEEKGVRLWWNSTVTRIDARGVQVQDTHDAHSSQLVPADLIVVNADLPYAQVSLLSAETAETRTTPVEKYDWNDSFDFSSGVIAFHWSIDKVLEDLNTHNVFLVANSRSAAEASWRVLRNPGGRDECFVDDDCNTTTTTTTSVEPFNFYVHRASRTDPTAAPTGCDAILVLVPCRTLSRRNAEYADLPREQAIAKYKEQFDAATVHRARDAVLRRLSAIESLRDLRQHIVNEVVDTPATYADLYNVGAGTPFGLSHGFSQLSLTRPGPESFGIPNVLAVGASSRPGNGVPLVLLGAKQVAERAAKKLESIAKRKLI